MSLASVSQRLPFTYTGADFYALCSDAMLKAVTRQAAAVDAQVRALNADPTTRHEVSTAYFFDHYATPADIAVMVTEADFIGAHEELIPSVSAGELAHYEKVRALFEGGADEQKQQQQKQQQQQLTVGGGDRGKRPVSSTRSGDRSASASASASKGKGKGKAIATTDDELEADEERANGNGKGKGKGKAVMGFQDGTASDDGDLYE